MREDLLFINGAKPPTILLQDSFIARFIPAAAQLKCRNLQEDEPEHQDSLFTMRAVGGLK